MGSISLRLGDALWQIASHTRVLASGNRFDSAIWADIMAPVRIGIDARILAYRRGGIASYVANLLSGLASVDAESSYTVLHNWRDRESEPPGSNFRAVTVFTPCHHRLERWALGAEIMRLRLDLLHSPDFIPPAFGAPRFVITVHDLNFLFYPQFLTAESRRFYNQQIEWAVRRAAHILADSEVTRQDLIRLLEVAPEKVTTVHLAAEPRCRPLPPADVQPVLASYKLQPGYILFVGTVEPRKNLPGLLSAYRALLDRKLATVPLVIVGGRGWLYEETFERVEELSLADHVRFLHNLTTAELPALYNGAAVLAAPSFYEGFGLPALEAMACGTPVVISDRGSLPEVVGDAGMQVDPEDVDSIADGLAAVLTRSELADRLREAGLARAASFTWEETARQTLSIYRSVV